MQNFSLEHFMLSPINLVDLTIRRIDFLNINAIEKAAGISGGNLTRSLRSENGMYPESYAKKVRPILTMLGFMLESEPRTLFQNFVTEANIYLTNSKKQGVTKKSMVKFLDRFMNDSYVYEFKDAETLAQFKPIIAAYVRILKLTKTQAKFAEEIILNAYYKTHQDYNITCEDVF